MVVYDPQDGPWKLVLRTYFREAIAFFFPETAKLIDWRRPPEFLDKEFQQIAPETETGRRFADQLVKVKRKRGKELWLLLHTEVQAAREALEASDNPFAVVVMTHLKVQETKKDKQSRKEWKLQLIRRLYEKGYNRDDIVNLFRFIDWMMVLPKGLDRSFWTELKTYEEARKVPYITSVERIGFERGLEEGQKLVLQRQLIGKFGILSESLNSAVEELDSKAIESLSIALLNFSSIEDLETWLAQH